MRKRMIVLFGSFLFVFIVIRCADAKEGLFGKLFKKKDAGKEKASSKQAAKPTPTPEVGVVREAGRDEADKDTDEAEEELARPPQIPQIPQVPQIPRPPEIPRVPQVPRPPEILRVPRPPEIPQVPRPPSIPRLPEVPQVPKLPVSPPSIPVSASGAYKGAVVAEQARVKSKKESEKKKKGQEKESTKEVQPQEKDKKKSR